MKRQPKKPTPVHCRHCHERLKGYFEVLDSSERLEGGRHHHESKWTPINPDGTVHECRKENNTCIADG